MIKIERKSGIFSWSRRRYLMWQRVRNIDAQIKRLQTLREYELASGRKVKWK